MLRNYCFDHKDNTIIGHSHVFREQAPIESFRVIKCAEFTTLCLLYSATSSFVLSTKLKEWSHYSWQLEGKVCRDLTRLLFAQLYMEIFLWGVVTSAIVATL